MQHWRKNRAPTRYSVNLLVGSASHRVTIVNVNEDGAGLEGVPPLPAGSQVSVQLMHHRLPARLAWQKDTAAGLTFKMRLGAQMLSTLRRLIGPQNR